MPLTQQIILYEIGFKATNLVLMFYNLNSCPLDLGTERLQSLRDDIHNANCNYEMIVILNELTAPT